MNAVMNMIGACSENGTKRINLVNTPWGRCRVLFSVKTDRVGVLDLFRAMDPFASVVKHKDPLSETWGFDA